MTTRRFRRTSASLLLALLLSAAAAAQEAGGQAPPLPGTAAASLTAEERAAAIEGLAPEYRQWLQRVRGLITAAELDYFLTLREDFRRDDFMVAFWKPRDPDPRTAANELKARWEGYLRQAGGLPYGDPRFLLLLFNGPPGGWNLPNGRPVARCFSPTRELEIWFYEGSERTDRRFPVILLRRAAERPYEAYLPGEALRANQRTGGLPTNNIQQLCAEELLRYALYEISLVNGYDRLLEKVLSPPLPSPEWLANLAGSGTDLPPGAVTFEVETQIDFPARNQSRTALRVVLAVPREAAPGRRFDGELYHNFQLVGEVIRDGRRFESFRYRFEGPTPEAAAGIPLGFTRYLRPGPADLRILVEDVYSGRYARVARQIDVPSPEGLPAVPAAVVSPRPSGASLELLPPPGKVHAGKVRFRARSRGELDKVTFYIDDRPVMSKRKPPYSVELDLGRDPAPHRVRVVGFAADREVATDQIWLNQGAQRFRVLLIEPRAGGIYPGSLTVRAEVETPDGQPPERLELYLNDERVAELGKPPYVQSVRLSGSDVAVVRAVAYLADGSSAEDAVVVNASPFVEEVEVRLVEVYARVVDRDGRPITDLKGERFRLFEDGVEQRIERFEPLADAPLHAALLVDRSASMEPHLGGVVEAALGFAAATSEDDRVAVFSFAGSLRVDAGFDAGPGAVERALAGLDAGGETALYDSLVQGLNNFDGVAGPSALLVFSDGRDETSHLTFEQTLEAARRAGVTLYSIGLAEAFPEKQDRRVLADLAAETGGEAFFLAGLDELDGVYLEILGELRARYLLAYQPPSGGSAGFRTLRVEVDHPGAEVRARRGYYP